MPSLLHIMLCITDISGFDRSDHQLAQSLSVLSLSLAVRVGQNGVRTTVGHFGTLKSPAREMSGNHWDISLTVHIVYCTCDDTVVCTNVNASCTM